MVDRLFARPSILDFSLARSIARARAFKKRQIQRDQPIDRQSLAAR
jgi:hypothetical protein